MKLATVKSYAAKAAGKVRRGSTLLLTLVYVLMFAALASSMVAFSQGNVMVQGADTDAKIAVMSAESGMSFLLLKMQKVSLPIITEGNISGMASPSLLWSGTNVESIANNNGVAVSLANAINSVTPWGSGVTGVTAPTGTNPLIAAPISLDPGNSRGTFTLSATFDPTTHIFPNTTTSYLAITLKSVGQCNSVSRYVTMEVDISKQLKYAVYSNVAIQLGKNVHVIGDIASTYAGTSKGPPIQMFSDFHFLTNTGNIDSSLATLRGLLATYDSAHINRIDLSVPAAAAAAKTAGLTDVNGDGFIDEWDVALKKFGSKTDPGQIDQYGITKANFTDAITGKLYDPDLFSLNDDPMGTNVTPAPWAGYNDGVIDYKDNANGRVPAKVLGSVKMAIPYATWQSAASGWSQWGDTTGGTAGTTFNDQFEGTIVSDEAKPVQFGVDFSNQQTLTPQDFNTSSYDAKITNPSSAAVSGATVSNGTLDATALTNLAKSAPSNYVPVSSSKAAVETSPFNVSSGYQATYKRPVFTGITFNNVRIPAGLNAAFVNCTFNGYTSVQMNTSIVSPTTSQNTNADGTTPDPNGGMAWAQQTTNGGTFSASGVTTTTTTTTIVNGKKKTTTTTATNPLDSTNSVAYTQGNNLHFSGCTINGVMTASVPTAYTHFADSWEFDGATTFNNTVDPSVTIMAPNTNIEMGGFTNPTGNPSTLVGVVVAGNIDVRGNANVDGSLIVTGLGAANTTLGYFGSTDQGQGVPIPGQLPTSASGSYGHLFFQLNTSRGMPNGIAIPVIASPQYATYQFQ